jgi:putative copper resistance protein D
MEGSGDWIFIALIAARATQFVATVVACGGMLFLLGILGPALSRNGTGIEAYPDLRRRLSLLGWAAFVVLFLSAFCVLALQSADMSGAPLSEVASGGVLWTVLTETAFGNAWSVRLVLLLLLVSACARPAMRAPRWFDLTRVALSLSVAGALAWTGHANAGSALQRSSHLAVDVLHLIAAAAWLGSLLPLAFILQDSGTGALPVKTVRFIVARFSNVGVVSVAVLIVSGIVNTLMVLDEPRAVFESTYGRILLLKVSLFLIMLALAIFNRQRLTPQLVNSTDAPPVVRSLWRNCLIEAALGATILVLVGALGILSPNGE